MADRDQFNADQLAFWNGVGGETWVMRQAHTDITLQPVSDALLAHAASIEALDISGSMLAEARRRASAAGIFNVEWRQADAATTKLERPSRPFAQRSRPM